MTPELARPVECSHGVQSSGDEPSLRIPCPTCGRRVRVPATAAGRTFQCKQCGERMRVPDFGDSESTSNPRPPATKPPATKPPAAGDEAGAATDGERKRKKKRKRSTDGLPPVYREEKPAPPKVTAPPPSQLDALAEIRQVERDPPPAWTFFSDVFEMPLQPAALARWACLTFGLVLTGLVGTIVLSMAGALSGGFAGAPVGVAVAFFVLPLFWLGLYTFSYAAACGMAILEETSAGNNRIVHWPEPQWKDWAMQLLPLVYLLALVSVPAWGLGEIVRHEFAPEWRWAAIGLTVAILFPFALLCTLESGSLWAPFSGVVTGSLFPLWWAWLTYYVLAALAGTFWVACLWIGFFKLRAPFLSAMATAPILAYVIFVEARLLGRLAWRIGERGVAVEEDEE